MSTKIFTVDKFLGLNESPNGSTGLKLGEASKAENFYITDDYKLKTRPGVNALARRSADEKYIGIWEGLIGSRLWLITVSTSEGAAYCNVEFQTMDDLRNGESFGFPLFCDTSRPLKIFTAGDKVYIYGAGTDDAWIDAVMEISSDADGNLTHREENVGYAPVIVTGCNPDGGGTVLEPLNILSHYVRVQFSSDGSSTVYKLPSVVSEIKEITVDGVTEVTSAYEGEPNNIQYVFEASPPKGVNNVEMLCRITDSDHYQAGQKFLQMRHCEAYNGSTDTRLFFYGDGTNILYYTGVPTYGEGLYLPAGNEIAVDSSASAVTGLRRHYTRLMAYKPDGAFSITYDPVTLEDGTVTAGFYVCPASRDVGNDMDGQIQTVGNYPRTLCGGSLYEWRHTASFYQDERYAKRISEKIAVTLAAADPAKIITCDDDTARTYYMFLNDDTGAVLVNRYELDAWTIYTGEVFKNVRFADGFHGDMLFANDNAVFCFDPGNSFDAPVEEGGDPVPIVCSWESGYMAFGADYLRKYSSTLWISMLPEPSSQMDITVATDRRDEYMVKSAGRPLFDFSAVDFSNFSFLISRAPKMQRIKLKVKKFVYYKLIFNVTAPGARATVLGYDQQVRFASYVK